MMPTIGETITQVREMEGSVAVKRMLAGHLRLRYIGRDSSAAVAQVRSADGSPVEEAVVELEAQLLESEAKSIERTIKAARATPVARE